MLAATCLLAHAVVIASPGAQVSAVDGFMLALASACMVCAAHVWWRPRSARPLTTMAVTATTMALVHLTAAHSPSAHTIHSLQVGVDGGMLHAALMPAAVAAAIAQAVLAGVALLMCRAAVRGRTPVPEGAQCVRGVAA